jgi:hypothetical protein
VRLCTLDYCIITCCHSFLLFRVLWYIKPSRWRTSIFNNWKRSDVESRFFLRRRYQAQCHTDLFLSNALKLIMLHPRSSEWQSELFKTFITTVIAVDLLVFIIYTESTLHDNNILYFRIADGITSSIFLVEYIARLVVVIQNGRYGDLGPVLGRLRWMVTFPAIIDALATMPFFIQLATGWALPTLTYLRVFRILRILRTYGYVRAFGACYRVICYNREILCGAAGLYLPCPYNISPVILFE